MTWRVVEVIRRDPPVEQRSKNSMAVRDEIWVTVLIVLASIGIAIALGLWIFTLYKIVTLDIKTRNLWLSQVLLFFVFLSYGTCFIFIPIPSIATCAAIRFLPGFCYAGLFAGMLVKTLNIISESRHIYVPGYFQITLFMALLTVQLCIGLQWLLTIAPVAVVASDDNGNERLLCDTSLDDIVLTYIYLMVLVLVLCIVTSVARRWTVLHHEEAFLLSVCVGFIVPVWVAWTLLGTIGSGRHPYEDPCLAFGLLVTTTLILILVFLPRARRLSKISRTLHHVTFGEAQYAVPNKALMAVNSNPSFAYQNAQLTRKSFHHSSASLHSVSQFSPSTPNNLVPSTRDISARLINRSAVSTNTATTKPDSRFNRIYVTPTNEQRMFYAKPVVYQSRDHMWTEGGTHL